jgi:putative Ca2+/H+ antiporter (TMEM165/GDT1 family)
VDPVALAVAFGTIFVVELPDKTFLATLVLATRYRPLFVWIGVSLAFAVQTVVAVLLGHAASFLPEDLVRSVAAGMFLLGAVLLLREGRSHHQSTGEEYVASARDVHGVRQVLACFLVLFAAEWGDLSQLFTITLVARFEDPVGVFVGALGALMTVSALAVLVGRQLLRWIPLHVLHYVGAGVCLVLSLLTVHELLAG